MQTKTITVYAINELSDKAKEYALDQWNENWDNPWASENRQSLYKFAEIFNITIKDFCYGSYSSRDGVTWSDNWEFDLQVESLTGIRLLKWLENNVMKHLRKGKYYSTKGTYDAAGKYHYAKRYSKCQFEISCPMTGYYMDMEIIDPILEFVKKPTDKINLKQLIDNCMDAWVNACVADGEEQRSMESFIEACESNNYTFTESGDMENV